MRDDRAVLELCKAARRAIHDFDMFQAGHFSEATAAETINQLSVALVKVERWRPEFEVEAEQRRRELHRRSYLRGVLHTVLLGVGLGVLAAVLVGSWLTH